MEELQGGEQSRSLAGLFEGRRVVAKLTDRRFVDPAELGARMHAVEALGSTHPAVVVPTRIGGELVHPLGDWLMTLTPFVEGTRLDVSDPVDGQHMGQALATLHQALAILARRDLPPVAALASHRPTDDQTDWQILHGDFSDQNLIATAEGLRILDFDDCGYGPAIYDVANSLYMVLFDSEVNRRPVRYEVFRESFLSGYASGTGLSVDRAAVEQMITVRIGALSGWLDDPASAPVGIRTSSPEWKETLRSFVRSHM